MAKESRRKEKNYKSPKKIEISLSKKNIIIRAIIACACLLLAAIMITRGCTKINNSTGDLDISYPTFESSNNEEEVLFDNIINIKYYYDKETENTRKKEIIEKIEYILEDLVEYHKLLDHDDTYTSNNNIIHNLKYINDNPNQWIEVDIKLFNALKEAVDLSLNTDGKYSIFAGKLYEKWYDVFSHYKVSGSNLMSIQRYDPLYYKDMQTSIETIVKAINEESSSLEFNDETKEVKFNVLDSNKPYVMLDLGLFEYAYYMDYLKAILISNNLTSGMISSKLGMVATLGQNKETGYYQLNSISMQTIYQGDYVFDYSFAHNHTLNSIMFNPLLNYNLRSDLDTNFYYFFDENNNVIIRSLILNCKTGYTDFSVHSTFTFSSNKGLVYQLIDNYNLYFNEELDYGNNYLANLENIKEYGAMVVYNNGNNNISAYGNTTLLYSSIVSNYFEEEYIPYVKVNEVVKTKKVATKGE